MRLFLFHLRKTGVLLFFTSVYYFLLYGQANLCISSQLLYDCNSRILQKKTKELKNRTLSNQNGGNPPSLPLTRQLQRWRGAVRVRSIDTSFEIDGEGTVSY